MQAMDFVKKLLKIQPDRRMTAEDALNHPWITDLSTESEDTEISENLKTRLMKFRKVDKLKKEFKLILLNYILQDSDNINKLDTAFNKLDKDNSGFIDLSKIS